MHVAYFAERVGLTSEQVTSLTHGTPAGACWSTERDRVLIEVADSVHDTARIGDRPWERLSTELTEAEILDALMLCGWYHAICNVANGVQLELEEGTPRFADAR